MRKKILFVYDSMMTGGTSTALLSLMNTVDRKKYDVNVILYTNTGAQLDEIPSHVNVLPPAYKERSIPFLTSSQRKIIRTVLNFGIVKAVLSFWRYKGTAKGKFRNILMHHGIRAQVSLSRMVTEHYDVAIGFMEGWSNQYVISKKINADRKLLWVHPQYKNCYLIPEIDRPFFRKADGIAVVAEGCVEQFLEYFPECSDKLAVIPNILSSDLIQKKAKKATVSIEKAAINFCTVCRCDMYVKGIDRILNALSRLSTEGLCDGVVWHLIGGGADSEKIKKYIEINGLNDNVKLYGNQKNPLPYIVNMDVFLLASRYEGKPMSVTEAQILGLPCIVTNYASATSQVENGYNGLVIDNNDESVYFALKSVLLNPNLIQMWKDNMHSCNFSNETDVEKFYSLLEDNRKK